MMFVSLSDYNGLRKLQGMEAVDLSENNYRILYDKKMFVNLQNNFMIKISILLLMEMCFLR